ncbi:hypothetical protein SARC_14037 [Sphaeroforma arctica JP610]|uniref:Receptor expression-enhancing protein n=1 Tax=Sphaeroforma arctica JP610 TaxID=667725 RepID=A0A0L0FBE0_9EUKA|nr:hypothetical protein SARC_14037 [Sphaeroforma arctica JP610]KNC73408.1 hypothetical protein SARC_14037 [Sphaeroforma arctica JP610]|eukprot:XP_014147310.1 hypothetical protein SARC_14037 [Sphaeroforma arctica JP610]
MSLEEAKVQYQKLAVDLNKKFGSQPQIKQVTEKTGAQAAHVVLGGAAIAFLSAWLIFGADFVTTLVAVVYPAYASIQAIEALGSTDDAQWLTYWVIYACLNVLEFGEEYLLEFIPVYYVVKMCLCVWMFLPSTQGASIVYKNAIKPLVNKDTAAKVSEAISTEAKVE